MPPPGRAAVVRWGQLTIVIPLRQCHAADRWVIWLVASTAAADLLRCVGAMGSPSRLHLRTLLRRCLPPPLLRLARARGASPVEVHVGVSGRLPVDHASSRRFGALAASAAHAAFLNAYVSTLGGGYYMTRHHVDAVRSAALQMSLAAARDDVSAFVYSFTHLAYIGASSGCDRVARWAARMAVRMARVGGLAREGATHVATRVALRYTRNVARVRATHELPLSARECADSAGMDDARLATCIRAAFRAAGVPIAVPPLS